MHPDTGLFLPPQPLARVTDIGRFGAKAANLGWLHRQGVPIPLGWALAAHWLRDHLNDPAAQACVEAVTRALQNKAPDDTLAALGAAVIEHIETRALSASARAALEELLQREGPGPWVVRSSAVGEDSENASFAGQLESVLHCRTHEDIERALRRVWASAFSAHCLAYQKLSGQRLRGVGVIVCRQVRARHAGVLFTNVRSPAGDRALLVEYTDGLADALVAGEVTPAQAWLGRQTLEVRAHKRGETDVLLDESVLRTLAQQAMALERSCGEPLDIEWCVDADALDAPVFVQARPVTSGRAGNVQMWSNANIAENFPDPVCPMVASFVSRGYHAYFEGLARVFGVTAPVRQALQPAFRELVGVQQGRLYYNITRLREVLESVPAGEQLFQAFSTFTGAPAFARPPADLAQRSWTWSRTLASLARHYWPLPRRIRRFEARVDQYARAWPPAQIGQRDALTLAAGLEQFLFIRLQRWQDASLADCAAMMSYAALQAFTRRWLPQAYERAQHQALLKGLAELPSNRPVLELWNVAQALKAHPALAQALVELDANALADRLDDPALAPMGTLVRDYIEQWGFRSSRELTLIAPTPHEDPRPTLELLKRYASLDGAGPAEQLRTQAREREQVQAALHDMLDTDSRARTLTRWLHRALFGLVVRACQESVKYRERVRFKQALLYACLRHVALAAGEQLAAQGLLERRDDVFMLTIDEAIATLRGAQPYPQALRGTVQARRRVFEDAARTEPPDLLELETGQVIRGGYGPVELAAGPDMRGFAGTAACAGVYEGEAIVLEDASQIHLMHPGQVLVTRQTDPGWASAFFLAKALVVERGGMLSHGAIVAREFGIPAVVGVPGITRAVISGERVRVNGFEGRVEKL